MSNDKNKTPEEKGATDLKKISQKNKDALKKKKNNDDQPTAEEAAEQIKGSDADIDRSVGFDQQPDLKESQEQIKGSDADSA